MYSLLPYNTFGIDVSAARFLEYSSVEELKNGIRETVKKMPLSGLTTDGFGGDRMMKNAARMEPMPLTIIWTVRPSFLAMTVAVAQV